MKLRGSWFRWIGTNQWGFGWKSSAPFTLKVELTDKGYRWSIKDNSDQYFDVYPENWGIRKTLVSAQKAAERRLIAYINQNILNPKGA